MPERTDTERLDWLERTEISIIGPSSAVGYPGWIAWDDGPPIGDSRSKRAPTLRQAIDRAMDAEPKPKDPMKLETKA
jgi:hypothetical protein